MINNILFPRDTWITSSSAEQSPVPVCNCTDATYAYNVLVLTNCSIYSFSSRDLRPESTRVPSWVTPCRKSGSVQREIGDTDDRRMQGRKWMGGVGVYVHKWVG
eukprot:765503-Hanusia_phi.AAC.6